MEKQQKKKIIIFLVGCLIGVFGFASCFFMYINTPNAIEITYDNGDILNPDQSGLVFTKVDKTIYLEKVVPTLDKFGVLEKGFSFSIKNNYDKDVDYELRLEDNNSTIDNSDIRYEFTKNGEVVGIYNLNDDGILERLTIKSGEEISYTIKLWLDYNSEVKEGRFNKKIAILEFSGDKNISHPVLVDGMIPVYYDNDTNSWHKAKEENTYNKWYSYEEGKWANAVTINSDKRKYYQESEIDTEIKMEDINSMWVWIPRFSYSLNNEEIEITFVNKGDKAYLAFTFNEIELDGFWFAKFEGTMKTDSECITTSLTKKCNNSNNKLYFVPNYPFATKMTMANMFYAIRKMELKNNIYGFNGTGTKLNNNGTIKDDKNNIDIHMTKNIEWQAVALLSISKYGNEEIIRNNNSNISGKTSIDNNDYDYDVKGDSSTTGNITGVYDMSGGKREYVMINNSEQNIFDKKSNSGFTTKVEDYYYDNDFVEIDTTLKLKNKYGKENEINNEPITRGGYKNTGNIFNLYGTKDYIDKVSVETNSRACLVIIEGEGNE